MDYKEKLYFGKGVWVDCRRVVPAVGKHIGRLLTQDEINSLYRAINSTFREEFTAHEDQWNEWTCNSDDSEFTLYLKVHDIGIFSGFPGVKNVQVVIRKNLRHEVPDCWSYIATVVYGSRRSASGQQKSIRDFTVNGRKLYYRKFAFDNLVTALETVGKIRAPDRMGWVDVVMENMWESYSVIPDEAKENKFVVETGMGLLPDVFDDEYAPRSPISILVSRLDDKCWDIQIVVANDLGNPKFIEDCIPRLYRRVDRKTLKDAAVGLARIADLEDWSYKHKPYGALLYYIESVYDRLEQERAAGDQNVFAVPNGDEHAIVFCTGLVTPDASGSHYIYAYCSLPDEKGVFHQVEWLTHSGTRKGGVTYNHKLIFDDTRVNHGLPYPPHWISSQERLLFDYRFGSINEGHIAFFYPHIFENLRTRLPEPLRSKFCSRFSVYNETEFKEYLSSAWRDTRKILQKSFKVAIPTYYRGKIQLLVPLYLDESDKKTATVALVVALNEKKEIGAAHYFCPTCLTLEMARMDSRVITRVDDTWLACVK